MREEPAAATLPALLGPARARQLHDRLAQQGSLRVATEARRFQVSEETIRRDIKRLAAEGLARPVFGGALLPDAARGQRPPPVSERGSLEERAKEAIGAAAAALLDPGQVVVLDAGTTTHALARHLGRLSPLTVLTNSLPVAQACADNPGCAVHLVGGRLVPASLSLIGPQAERDLAEIRADWTFLGAAAIDAEGGCTSADPYEAQVKRAMVRAGQRVVLLADPTKFGARRFMRFAGPEDITHLVTSAEPPAELRMRLDDAGVTLILAPPDPAPSDRTEPPHG